MKLKWVKYTPGVLVAVMAFSQNHYFSHDSDAGALYCIVYFSILLTGSCFLILRSRLSGAIKGKHRKSKIIGYLVTLLFLASFSARQLYLLTEDFSLRKGAGFQHGRFVVLFNDENLMGAFFLQQVHFRDVATNRTISGSYLMRTDYLREGQCRDLTYGASSLYVFDAMPCRND